MLVLQALTKMGVKFTSKPLECTHLVARSLVRTEKFLCAIARAPYILSEKWLVASYAAKQLLRAPPPPLSLSALAWVGSTRIYGNG